MCCLLWRIRDASCGHLNAGCEVTQSVMDDVIIAFVILGGQVFSQGEAQLRLLQNTHNMATMCS